jgi:hypothetical protein
VRQTSARSLRTRSAMLCASPGGSGWSPACRWPGVRGRSSDRTTVEPAPASRSFVAPTAPTRRRWWCWRAARSGGVPIRRSRRSWKPCGKPSERWPSSRREALVGAPSRPRSTSCGRHSSRWSDPGCGRRRTPRPGAPTSVAVGIGGGCGGSAAVSQAPGAASEAPVAASGASEDRPPGPLRTDLPWRRLRRTGLLGDARRGIFPQRAKSIERWLCRHADRMRNRASEDSEREILAAR